MWNEIFSENDAMSILIKKLKKKNILLLLSNTNEPHFNYVISRFDVLNQFDDYILSYKIGFRKPKIEIFKSAIERFPSKYQNLFFIDDIIDNVRIAESIGIKGFHFT